MRPAGTQAAPLPPRWAGTRRVRPGHWPQVPPPCQKKQPEPSGGGRLLESFPNPRASSLPLALALNSTHPLQSGSSSSFSLCSPFYAPLTPHSDSFFRLQPRSSLFLLPSPMSPQVASSSIHALHLPSNSISMPLLSTHKVLSSPFPTPDFVCVPYNPSPSPRKTPGRSHFSSFLSLELRPQLLRFCVQTLLQTRAPSIPTPFILDSRSLNSFPRDGCSPQNHLGDFQNAQAAGSKLSGIRLSIWCMVLQPHCSP